MDRAALIAALQANAAVKKAKPISLDGIGQIFLRPATIADTEDEITKQGDANHRVSRRLARMLCDENGDPLLNADDPGDLELLRQQPESVFAQITQMAADLNGISEEGREELGKA